MLRLLNHPGHASQKSHGGGRGGSVDDLPRLAAAESIEDAARNTNPRFGDTGAMDAPTYRGETKWTPEMGPPPSGAFEENCTNAVMAFDMRQRGYDVQAAPLAVLDRYGYAAGRAYSNKNPEIDEHLADSYTLPDGRPHGRGLATQTWRSFDEIDREVESWPEGGRGAIYTGKHVFSVVKSKGKARYIEAQHGLEGQRRDVTRAYKKKFRGADWSDGSREEGKLVRLDDLVPTDAMLETVVAP